MMTYKGRNELSIIRLADPIRNYRKNTMDFINDIKSVLVEFNNVPDFKSASNPAIYKVRWAGKKQKIGSVEVYRNLAMLSLEDNDKATKLADENAGLLEVDIRNLRDINGNRIFEYDYIVGYQFRELFINDINPNYSCFQHK